MDGYADLAVIPGLGLARQKLPYIQTIPGDGSVAASGPSATGSKTRKANVVLQPIIGRSVKANTLVGTGPSVIRSLTTSHYVHGKDECNAFDIPLGCETCLCLWCLCQSAVCFEHAHQNGIGMCEIFALAL